MEARRLATRNRMARRRITGDIEMSKQDQQPNIPQLKNVPRDEVERTEIFGHVVSVTGPRAVAVLSETSRSIGVHQRRVDIGSFLKMETPHCAVMGLVTAVSTPMPMSQEQE